MPDTKMQGETREWLVVTDGAITLGDENKIFRQGAVIKASELGDQLDFFFEQHSLRWADAHEVPKAHTPRRAPSVSDLDPTTEAEARNHTVAGEPALAANDLGGAIKPVALPGTLTGKPSTQQPSIKTR